MENEIKKKPAYNNAYTAISPMRADCEYAGTLCLMKKKKMKITILQILIILLLNVNCGIGQNKIEKVEINKTITDKQIETLQGIKLIHEVFVTIAVKWNNSFKSKRVFVESLSEEQKLVYAIWILDMNVKNGGFQQYYHNSNGEIYDISAIAAKEMKMDKIVEVVTKANKIFLVDNTEDKEISFSDKQRDELSKLDIEYYKADTDKYVYNSIANYIKANKEKFVKKEH